MGQRGALSQVLPRGDIEPGNCCITGCGDDGLHGLVAVP